MLHTDKNISSHTSLFSHTQTHILIIILTCSHFHTINEIYATHQGHEMHQVGSMERVAKIKSAAVIENSTEIRAMF